MARISPTMRAHPVRPLSQMRRRTWQHCGHQTAADSKPVFRPASYRLRPSMEARMELLIGFVTTLCISLLIFRK